VVSFSYYFGYFYILKVASVCRVLKLESVSEPGVLVQVEDPLSDLLGT
jgi:hypothetical protein